MFRKQGLRAQGGQARSYRRSGVKSRSKKGFARRTTQSKDYFRPRFGISRSLQPISGDRYRTTHKYSTSLIISVTSGVSNVYVFRGNSVYDPDFTSTGYSALGYGTMSGLYARYLVTGSSIRVRSTSLGSSALPVHIGLVPSLSSSAISSSPADLAENAYGKDVLGSSQYLTGMSNYMSTSKIYGEALQDDNYAGAVGFNPTNSWFWQLKIENSNIDTTAVNVLVDLVYYTEWSRRSSFSSRP